MRNGIGIAILLLAACSSPPRYSGFLGDYKGFKQSKIHANTYGWEKPGVDLRDYDDLMIDKVEVWLLPDSEGEKLDAETRKKVAAAFDRILRRTLAPYYDVVERPGPNVMRMRIAITDIAPAGQDVEGGPDVSVGAASMELELIDSVSGERLGAAVDKIVGSYAGQRAPKEWRSVEGAFIEWANRILDYLDRHHAD